MSSETTSLKTTEEGQPTSPTEVKLNQLDNLPQPDTWLYRNDSFSKAKREVSRRSLADLMNPNAEPSEEILLAKKKAEEPPKLSADEEAKQKAEEEAKKKAEDEAKQKAEEEAKKKAEEDAKKKAEEESKQAEDALKASHAN